MALTLCRNWFSTEYQIYDFSLQTIIRPVVFYNRTQDAGQPVLKNTRMYFVETFLPPPFFLQSALLYS